MAPPHTPSSLKHLICLLADIQPLTGLMAYCEQCREDLPLFISDELARLPVDETYPHTAGHLGDCEACMDEYIELSRLARAALFGEVES